MGLQALGANSHAGGERIDFFNDCINEKALLEDCIMEGNFFEKDM